MPTASAYVRSTFNSWAVLLDLCSTLRSKDRFMTRLDRRCALEEADSHSDMRPDRSGNCGEEVCEWRRIPPHEGGCPNSISCWGRDTEMRCPSRAFSWRPALRPAGVLAPRIVHSYRTTSPSGRGGVVVAHESGSQAAAASMQFAALLRLLLRQQWRQPCGIRLIY